MTEFQDAENYANNFNSEGLTFREIILNHLRKISQFASVEFRGGFWESRQIISGSATNYSRVYIPDTREIYSNAVLCLADMLFPYFDDDMKNAEQTLMQELHDGLTNNKYEIEPEKESECYEDSATIERKRNIIRQEQKKINQTYRTFKKNVAKKLFRELCSFLYRKKYLELGNVED